MPQSVEGFVQHYAWGDKTFIPQLLGCQPDGQPWAELWLGTHPNGPAKVATADGYVALPDVVGELPYLLKILSAAQPLSLQAHPTTQQAKAGFKRGIYPDDRSKPELIVALTNFEALCGVRPLRAAHALLTSLGLHDTAEQLSTVAPGAMVRELLCGQRDPAPFIAACAGATIAQARWVNELNELYPGQPSVAATLLLNYVVLQPGQALRLEPGTLHAYLRGTGVELMAASDNVVRAGLTVKQVDLEELINVFDPAPLADPILAPVAGRYELPGADVALAVLHPGERHRSTGFELSIDMDGQSMLTPPGEVLTATATTYVVVSR